MKDDTVALLFWGFVLLVILGGGFGMKWYRAGIQTDIYRRQGIQMSRWEVFMGGEPAERIIQVKE